MAQPRILILRAPGTNCDQETAHAFSLAGGVTEIMHLNRFLESPQAAQNAQLLCLPGGFSYGDDIAAGRIFANQIRHHLADALQEFREAGKLVLGICNGFQVLLKTGLLDTDDQQGPTASLTWNPSGRFLDCWVKLESIGDRCVFLAGVDQLTLPIAHAEGRFVARDEQTLDAMEERGQLALRYCSAEQVSSDYNPNASLRDVAGICDRTGRVFGLMPHPERFVDPTQHPKWTRLPEREEGEGLQIFRNAVRYFL